MCIHVYVHVKCLASEPLPLPPPTHSLGEQDLPTALPHSKVVRLLVVALPGHALWVWHAVDVRVQVANEMSIALLREVQVTWTPSMWGCGPTSTPLRRRRCNTILYMYMYMHVYTCMRIMHSHESCIV